MEPPKTPETIQGKMVLIVDDEQDILDLLRELLHICKLDIASSYEEAKALLETKFYDIAVLDIMGVRGYELLDIATARDIPALMLTAHALSEKHLKQSAEKGASYYVPKDEIGNIAVFIADVLESKDKNKSPWLKWFDRLSHSFDKRFSGTDWREKEKDFWEKKRKGLHWR